MSDRDTEYLCACVVNGRLNMDSDAREDEEEDDDEDCGCEGWLDPNTRRHNDDCPHIHDNFDEDGDLGGEDYWCD